MSLSGPEAPPWSPGHVGHTPQHIPETLRRARLQGLFSTVPVRYVAALPNRLFPGRLPQLQQGIRERGPWASLMGIEDYQRRVAAAGPSRFPIAYLVGLEAPAFTKDPVGGGNR